MSTDNLIPFPTSAQPPQNTPGAEIESAPQVLDAEPLTDDEDTARAARRGTNLDRLGQRVIVLVRTVARSPQLAQLRTVVGYRLRQGPRDVTRLGWFLLRGHGR